MKFWESKHSVTCCLSTSQKPTDLFKHKIWLIHNHQGGDDDDSSGDDNDNSQNEVSPLSVGHSISLKVNLDHVFFTYIFFGYILLKD